MIDATNLVTLASTGMGVQLASVVPINPPSKALEAALHYYRVREKVRAHDAEADRKKREAIARANANKARQV